MICLLCVPSVRINDIHTKEGTFRSIRVKESDLGSNKNSNMNFSVQLRITYRKDSQFLEMIKRDTTH